MNPLNKLQQLVLITAEECGELTQRCSKILRRYSYQHEIEEDQRQKFVNEAGDVYCMLQLLIDAGITTQKELENRAAYKKEKLRIWSNLFDDKES